MSSDKAELMRRAYAEFAKLWEGKPDNFPWFLAELDRIEDEADDLEFNELRDELRRLYIQFKQAKEETQR